MTTQLPSRPNLDHLRKEAKDLLQAHTTGDRSACGILRGLRRFAKASDEEILKAEVKLQEIQLALAIKYGFENWSELSKAVSAAGGGAWPEKEVAVQQTDPAAQRQRIQRLEQLLAGGKSSRWDAEQLIEFFKSLTQVAQGGGLVALDGIAEKIDDPFMSAGLKLAIDGADAEIVRSVLLEKKRTMLMERERRLDMISAGVMALVWAESPYVVESRCRAFLTAGASQAQSE